MNKQTRIRFLTLTGVIAALYAVLTLCLAPLSFGLVQCRVAEVLTVLAVYTPAAVPGLTLGCAISNLLGLTMGSNIAGALDILLGTAATLTAALLSRLWGRYRVGDLPLWSTLPPVFINALVVGTELTMVVETYSWGLWGTQVGLVAAGQAVACIGGGLLLAKMLQSSGVAAKLENNDLH